ncbi:biopolymer transport protein ExbB [compost metagenome]
MSRLSPWVPVFLLLAAGPASAADGFGVSQVFADANILMKAIMVLLVAATITAVVVAVLKLMSGTRLTGGSAFLSALRLGGPLIGLLGAAYIALTGFMAVAQVGQTSLAVWSPAIAEASLLIVLGLLSGVVAVVAHWAVEARIDRAVLRA